MYTEHTNSNPFSAISADISVIDKNDNYNEFKLNNKYLNNKSIYSETPKRFKIGLSGFETLFPLVTEFDSYFNSFTSFTKTEVIVEFSVYVDFIVKHFTEPKKQLERTTEKFVISDMDVKSVKINNKEIDKKENVMFLQEEVYNYAELIKQLLDDISSVIKQVSTETNGIPSSDEVYNKLPEGIKSKLMRLVNGNPKILSDLWQSFIVNIAILNIKSVIVCGEYYQKKLKHETKPVIPLKFIPKLGSELSVLSKLEQLSLTEVKNRMITDDFKNDYKGKILISSLRNSEIDDILGINLEGNSIYIPEIAEQFGYTQERYSEAEQYITTSASVSTDTLSECSNYLDSLLDYLDALGALYSELKFMNEKEKCIILDFALD